jgi:leucyl-tRNA---protein transferase
MAALRPVFFFYQRMERDEDEPPYLVRPLRVDLQRFSFSKSQRRTWRKNDDLEIVAEPVQLSEEVVHLFETHRQRFQTNVPDSLSDFLGPEPSQGPTRLQQMSVHQGEKLVAMSFFDYGQESVSSIYGCFHPELAERRLGILTILAEIQWAQAMGMRWYYPGYAFVQPSHYDYKKEIGAVEYYDWKKWCPWRLGEAMI